MTQNQYVASVTHMKNSKKFFEIFLAPVVNLFTEPALIGTFLKSHQSKPYISVDTDAFGGWTHAREAILTVDREI